MTEATKNANCFEECNVFGNGKCELSVIQEGSPIKRWKFLARKGAKLFANTKVHILARRSTKLIANFSATKVTSLPSLSLSLSLCLSLYLSLSLSHRAHLTHNRKRFRASYIRASYNRNWAPNFNSNFDFCRGTLEKKNDKLPQ